MFWHKAYAGTISLPQAATNAVRIDALHDFLWWMSVFFLALITFATLYFAWKYHRSKKGRETAYILGSHTLEAIWTIIPLILMLVIFAWGYRDYLWLRTEPQNPVEINVIGRQWLWNFEYPNGRKTMNEVYVPKGKAVKMIMTSEDVLHSFYVPNFRLKQDVVPGMYTYIAFEATLTGEHPVYCAEYCGTSHSDMLAKLFVLEPKDYDEWLETGKLSAAAKNYIGAAAKGKPDQPKGSAAPTQSLADRGKELFNSKGCFACHTADGTPKVGPTLKGVFGKTEELADGSTVKIDENYIRESLMEPQKRITKGFPPSMPPFKGLLSDEEVNALIAYIKSLK
ncbi:MAG: cytochrome c oxidase subunit II [Bdellovibrionota bacterium]